MDLRTKEGAARTALPSFVAALRFMEEAGEVPLEARLHLRPAVQNTLKEAPVPSTVAGTATKQALPLTLSLLVALEEVVLDTKRPVVFTRGALRGTGFSATGRP